MPAIAGILIVIEACLPGDRDVARPHRESGYLAGETARPPAIICVIAKKLSKQEIFNCRI